MNDFSDSGNSPNGNDDAAALRVLTEQEDSVPSEFLARVRRSIYRRISVKQVSDFGWSLPGAALLELARIAGHLFSSFGKEKSRWK